MTVLDRQNADTVWSETAAGRSVLVLLGECGQNNALRDSTDIRVATSLLH